MELTGKSAIVTGAASGIGEAMARRFSREGARVLVADLDGAGARRVATDIASPWTETDVADEAAVVDMVAAAVSANGPVDLLCLNAGIGTVGGVETDDAAWQQTWDVNVMSHVYGVRAVLPSMLERGSGYVLHTASAAGLLTNLGAAPYSVTKHAVVALAEWLSITHGAGGIRVSCLCPQFVRTPMLNELTETAPGFTGFATEISLSPEEVAEAVVAGLREESFLILPHREVADYFRAKADDYERWLAGMRRLQAKLGLDPQNTV